MFTNNFRSFVIRCIHKHPQAISLNLPEVISRRPSLNTAVAIYQLSTFCNNICKLFATSSSRLRIILQYIIGELVSTIFVIFSPARIHIIFHAPKIGRNAPLHFCVLSQ